MKKKKLKRKIKALKDKKSKLKLLLKKDLTKKTRKKYKKKLRRINNRIHYLKNPVRLDWAKLSLNYVDSYQDETPRKTFKDYGFYGDYSQLLFG